MVKSRDFSPKEKPDIVRRDLLKNVPVSDLVARNFRPPAGGERRPESRAGPKAT